MLKAVEEFYKHGKIELSEIPSNKSALCDYCSEESQTRVPMLNINLDTEAEKYLVEILAQEKMNSSDLIKQLLYDRWHSFQPRQTVLERMGGYPEQLLEGTSDLSDRDVRKKIIDNHIQQRYEQQQ